ncbi:hypothetical protein [Piscinibacter terrae]|uniref:Uncharacterized protein n=1 Tax=Piscinibacter terrae TaxID=2496871 RepID=A0A3N7JXQ5_9BURK|nr:hypothetical protein [Albitalea terrae]RQP25619.1 hypothetical protein DZC73_00635 [Albitalea terrae]
MDRLPLGTARAAALVSLTLSLAACGGGSTSTPAAAPPGPTAQSVDGVTMPASVSVVTAKNAN